MISFFIDQHGCAKNQVDGELIISRLLARGLRLAETADEADLIIINSCGFIESAKRESIDAVLSARAHYPQSKILLAGCLAERYADELAGELSEADGIFGNGDLSRLDAVVDGLLEGSRPVERPPQEGVWTGERSLLLGYPGSAYVKITEGCANLCAFCAIPLIRGRLRSRTPDDIIAEIRDLVGRGVHEIILVGQDIAAYGMDGRHPHRAELWPSPPFPPVSLASGGIESPLASLLKRICEIEGRFWVRLLYLYPDHFPSDIIPLIASQPRILPYFDLPFQSGDDAIIRAMNRKGCISEYLSLVSFIRTHIPHAVIRTTFLAGFPGETDEAQARTLAFLRETGPDWSGCFAYSQEEGTAAARMPNQVPSHTAEKRREELIEAQAVITEERLRRFVGQTHPVIIEEILEGDEGIALGRSWFQAPEVDGATVISYEKDDRAAAAAIRAGEVIKVHMSASEGVNLSGVFVSASDKDGDFFP